MCVHSTQGSGPLDSPHDVIAPALGLAVEGIQSGKEPMAIQEHPMAQDHPRDNLRMRLHQPTIGQTKKTQPATTKEDNAPRPDRTPPNPPIGIGVLDMGLEMRKSYTRKAAI